MSAQSVPKLLTVEEYERIPDPPGGRYELHHGELVFVTWPVRRHKDLQWRLQEALRNAAEARGFRAFTEYPYRPQIENEVWSADVACVARARHEGVDKWLLGSPELAIEVKSPSNTKHELHDRAMTTLAGEGASEFWVVDFDMRCVTVYSKTSGMRNFVAPELVPVPLLDLSTDLAQLFEGI